MANVFDNYQSPNVRYTAPDDYRVEVEERVGWMRNPHVMIDGVTLGIPIGPEIEERGWPIPEAYLVDDAQARRIAHDSRDWEPFRQHGSSTTPLYFSEV